MNAAPRPLRLGFAGTPQFAVPTLDVLVNSRHHIVAVFTQPDRPAGRGQALHVSAVKRRALGLGLSIHQPQSFKSPGTAELLRTLDLDALVVVAYGLILPDAVLRIPRLGCLNIHASLLPRWRGAAPIQRALLAGDSMTGVTIMRMEAALDTGPMLARREVPITDGDTAATLHDRLASAGADLLVDTLERILDGSVREAPQSERGVTYADKISKAEGSIDWQQDAPGLLRRVRAFNPWPVAQTFWNGVQLRIWEAELCPIGSLVAPALPGAEPPGTIIAAGGEGIDVACGRGVLRILRLQLAGRKAVTAGEFVNGQRLQGSRFAGP